MSSNVNDGASQADKPSDSPQGPGSGPMTAGSIILVAAYLVLVSALVLYGLIKLWPYPTPSGERSTTDQVASASPTPSNSPSPAAGNSPTPAASPVNSTNPAASASSQTPPQNPAGSPTSPAGAVASPSAANSPSAPAAGQSPQNQPSPAGTAAGNQKSAKELPDPEHMEFFWGLLKADVYLETRLLLLVMLSGALGSLLHALRSLYWYTGNRKMVWSWVGLYMLLPVTGAILATIFYFIVRGGFFSPQASFDQTSPFGLAALSALVGLFSPQATLKLKEIAETIFSKPGPGEDNKPQESHSAAPPAKPAPTVTSVTPPSGAANASVVIAGTNFVDKVAVKFGGIPGTVSSQTSTSITVVVPANPSATGPVDVQVTNGDGQTVTFPQGFTYVAGGNANTTADATANTNAGGGAADELDGHEEIKSNTTDEELPITEGGVE